MNTSLFYEVLLYLNSFYFGMFAFCEAGMGVFKFVNLPYPTVSIVSEFTLLLFLCMLETGRIVLGRKGNLSERAMPVIISIALIIPSALAVLYFLVWQTYVLRLEVILCTIQLVLHGSELVFAFLCFIPSRKSPIF